MTPRRCEPKEIAQLFLHRLLHLRQQFFRIGQEIKLRQRLPRFKQRLEIVQNRRPAAPAAFP